MAGVIVAADGVMTAALDEPRRDWAVRVADGLIDEVGSVGGLRSRHPDALFAECAAVERSRLRAVLAFEATERMGAAGGRVPGADMPALRARPQAGCKAVVVSRRARPCRSVRAHASHGVVVAPRFGGGWS